MEQTKGFTIISKIPNYLKLLNTLLHIYMDTIITGQ